MDNKEELWKKGFSKKIHQKKKEIFEFIDILIPKQRGNALEIGCYTGGMSSILLNLYQSLTSIDVTYQNECELLKKEYPKWEYIIGNSQNLQIIEKIKDKKFDLIFIDGDHSEKGVQRDFELYKDLLNKSGIIAFHDILNSQYHQEAGCLVYNFWNRIKENYNSKEIIYPYEDILPYSTPGGDWGGIGVLFL